MNMPEKSAASC